MMKTKILYTDVPKPYDKDATRLARVVVAILVLLAMFSCVAMLARGG